MGGTDYKINTLEHSRNGGGYSLKKVSFSLKITQMPCDVGEAVGNHSVSALTTRSGFSLEQKAGRAGPDISAMPDHERPRIYGQRLN